MYSLEYINAINNNSTKEAKAESKEPLKATSDKDENIFKCPALGEYIPKGFKVVNRYWVDSSGFGSESEPALTATQFISKVRKGFYYAITGQGQFQIYISEYSRV